MFCYETSLNGSYEPRHASADGVNLEDEKTLNNLLRVSEFYHPCQQYIETVQENGFTTSWRQQLTFWMWEIAKDCEEGVLPHAVNLFDRYASVKKVQSPLDELQVLGATCLFIASKLRESAPISVDCLVDWGRYTYSIRDVRKWELEILNTLNWDTYVVLPHDLLDHFIQRLPIPDQMRVRVRDHARVLFNMCCTEYNFLRHSSRIMAAACLYDAVFGLGTKFLSLRNRLCCLMQDFVEIDMAEFQGVVAKLRQYVMSHRDAPSPEPQELEASSSSKETSPPLQSTPTNIEELCL